MRERDRENISMEFSTILGGWVAAFLTIGIFSYLYKDNPFYKIGTPLTSPKFTKKMSLLVSQSEKKMFWKK